MNQHDMHAHDGLGQEGLASRAQLGAGSREGVSLSRVNLCRCSTKGEMGSLGALPVILKAERCSFDAIWSAIVANACCAAASS